MTPNRAVVLTKYLKRYDKRLSAKWESDRMIHILFSDANCDSYVMSLTDNWSSSGKPVPWGIEPVIMRLRVINESENGQLAELRKQRERNEEIVKKDRRNNIEASLLDTRKDFAKSFEHINTSTLNKKYDKRRIKGA